MNYEQSARFMGSMIGVAVGDAWGSTYEFETARQIDEAGGISDNLIGGGVFEWPPGAPTDDTDQTLCLLRALTAEDPTMAMAKELIEWADCGPVDIGNQTHYAIESLRRGEPIEEISQGNGALMRTAPLAALAYRPERRQLADEIASLTHPTSSRAAVWLVEVLHHLVYEGTPLRASAAGWGALGVDEKIEQLKIPAYPTDQANAGWYRKAWAVAIRALDDLNHGAAPLDIMRATIAAGGDTDTNGAIVGGLLGAACGFHIWAPFIGQLRAYPTILRACSDLFEHLNQDA